MQNLLIVGTDTDVGKTVVTTALVAYWHAYRSPDALALMKLLQTGEGDGELYRELFEFPQPPETLVPVKFNTPVAPPVAAEREGMAIDLGKIWQTYQTLQQTYPFVFVEALGGLGSPVTHELTVADIAAQWCLNAVLVVPVKLGAIAQTVANVALSRQVKLNLKGIILNCCQPVTEEQLKDWTPVDLIQSLTHLPILGTIPYLANPKEKSKLVQIASNLDLERIFAV
ncbi:MAG: ATP-dependent dethiobiotin synthetase BioD [Cyanobacteria bacterium SBLK]|nr:ATP-dependent dethiobiotin synthetase BioD [Cyanobacteria bacterium SBLK]